MGAEGTGVMTSYYTDGNGHLCSRTVPCFEKNCMSRERRELEDRAEHAGLTVEQFARLYLRTNPRAWAILGLDEELRLRTKQVSVQLRRDEFDACLDLSGKLGVGTAEMIRRGVRIFERLESMTSDGKTLLIMESDETGSMKHYSLEDLWAERGI